MVLLCVMDRNKQQSSAMYACLGCLGANVGGRVEQESMRNLRRRLGVITCASSSTRPPYILRTRCTNKARSGWTRQSNSMRIISRLRIRIYDQPVIRSILESVCYCWAGDCIPRPRCLYSAQSAAMTNVDELFKVRWVQLLLAKSELT